MAEGMFEGTVTFPGTDVKVPKWALVAGGLGIVAALILAPKRGAQDQGDFDDEGDYDEGMGGVIGIIDELIDMFQGLEVPGLSEDLIPLVASPVSVMTSVSQRSEPTQSPSFTTDEVAPLSATQWLYQELGLIGGRQALDFWAKDAVSEPAVAAPRVTSGLIATAPGAVEQFASVWGSATQAAQSAPTSYVPQAPVTPTPTPTTSPTKYTPI